MTASQGKVGPVQAAYARWLVWFVRVGLLLMMVTSVAYAAGLVPSQVALDEVPALLRLPAESHRETGPSLREWGRLDDGAALALAALVFFPISTALLMVIAVVLYLRRRNWIFAALAAAQAVVLIVAAFVT